MMKKVILSAVMSFALLAAMPMMAQDAKKAECPKTEKSCCKEAKACCKEAKACCQKATKACPAAQACKANTTCPKAKK